MADGRTAYNRAQKARRRATAHDRAEAGDADAIADALLSAVSAIADRIADRIVRDLDLWKSENSWSQVADTADSGGSRPPSPLGDRGDGPRNPRSTVRDPVRADSSRTNSVRASANDRDPRIPGLVPHCPRCGHLQVACTCDDPRRERADLG